MELEDTLQKVRNRLCEYADKIQMANMAIANFEQQIDDEADSESQRRRPDGGRAAFLGFRCYAQGEKAQEG